MRFVSLHLMLFFVFVSASSEPVPAQSSNSSVMLFSPNDEFPLILLDPELSRAAFADPRLSDFLRGRLGDYLRQSLKGLEFADIKAQVELWEAEFHENFFIQSPDFSWEAFESKWEVPEATLIGRLTPTERALVVHTVSMNQLQSLVSSVDGPMPARLSAFLIQTEKNPSTVLRRLQTDSQYFWGAFTAAEREMREVHTQRNLHLYRRVHRDFASEFDGFDREWAWFQSWAERGSFSESNLRAEWTPRRMALVIALRARLAEEGRYFWGERDYEMIRQSFPTSKEFGVLSDSQRLRVARNTHAHIRDEYESLYREASSPSNFLDPLAPLALGEGSITRPLLFWGAWGLMRHRTRSLRRLSGAFPMNPDGFVRGMQQSWPSGLSEKKFNELMSNSNRKKVARSLKQIAPGASPQFTGNFWANWHQGQTMQAARARIEARHGPEMAKRFDRWANERLLIPGSKLQAQVVENCRTSMQRIAEGGVTAGQAARFNRQELAGRNFSGQPPSVRREARQFMAETGILPEGRRTIPLSSTSRTIAALRRVSTGKPPVSRRAQVSAGSAVSEGLAFHQAVRLSWAEQILLRGTDALLALAIADTAVDGGIVAGRVLSGAPEIDFTRFDPWDPETHYLDHFDPKIWSELIQELDLLPELKAVVSESLFSELRDLEEKMNSERRQMTPPLPEIEFILHPESVSAQLDEEPWTQGVNLVSGLFPQAYVLMRVKHQPSQGWEGSARRLQRLQDGILIQFEMHFDEASARHIGEADRVFWRPARATSIQEAGPRYRELAARAFSARDSSFQSGQTSINSEASRLFDRAGSNLLEP